MTPTTARSAVSTRSTSRATNSRMFSGEAASIVSENERIAAVLLGRPVHLRPARAEHEAAEQVEPPGRGLLDAPTMKAPCVSSSQWASEII